MGVVRSRLIINTPLCIMSQWIKTSKNLLCGKLQFSHDIHNVELFLHG